jgi:hypothetical protein
MRTQFLVQKKKKKTKLSSTVSAPLLGGAGGAGESRR